MKKHSAIRAAFLSVLTGLVMLSPLAGETFRYRFVDGDSYRINSVVNETVYVNRMLSHQADITNRITVSVSDVKKGDPQAAGAAKYGSARHDCTFMTSERNTNRAFSWGREYRSVFRRDELGNYDIGDEYFMPVVRNVPTFPEGDIKPGATWTGTGEEAHDLRDTFGIEKPFKVPFTVTYTYVGPVQRDGKTLHLIKAEYTMFFDSPERAGTAPNGSGKRDYPSSTMGYSRQQIYWDNELGLIPFYTEEFRIRMELESGTELEFRGTAEATVTDVKLLDRDKIVQEMNKEISKLGIANTTAKSTDEGITISIENIQFEADSANLVQSEKDKITKIAGILAKYPDKELLVSGHTALAGTASSRQKLSEERADAVAKFLVQLGVRSEYNVYTRGFGAEKPLVPNTTEENRARNRRVEITILDK
jgi:outer membrane protein OmpA-like peptidoglycan-associated protein